MLRPPKSRVLESFRTFKNKVLSFARQINKDIQNLSVLYFSSFDHRPNLIKRSVLGTFEQISKWYWIFIELN